MCVSELQCSNMSSSLFSYPLPPPPLPPFTLPLLSPTITYVNVSHSLIARLPLWRDAKEYVIKGETTQGALKQMHKTGWQRSLRALPDTQITHKSPSAVAGVEAFSTLYPRQGDKNKMQQDYPERLAYTVFHHWIKHQCRKNILLSKLCVHTR